MFEIQTQREELRATIVFKKEFPRYDSKLDLMVRFRFWRYVECEGPYRCNYFQSTSSNHSFQKWIP